MNNKKYVTFPTIHYGSITIKRDSIIGFETPDPLLVFTNVLLDSGAKIALNGIHAYDAQTILENFDKEENNAQK